MLHNAKGLSSCISGERACNSLKVGLASLVGLTSTPFLESPLLFLVHVTRTALVVSLQTLVQLQLAASTWLPISANKSANTKLLGWSTTGLALRTNAGGGSEKNWL